jgi:LacI family transcriptional regulator
LIQEGAVPGDVCAVRQDDRGGASELAEYVLSKGARRLMLLLPTVEWPAMVERERGFKQRIRKHGGELLVVRCRDEGMDATQDALRAGISKHGLPDAVLGGNDRMAIAALKLLAETGVLVPGQVRVTGFNGFESARYSSPELTSVRSPAYEMGRCAGQELLNRIESGRFAQRQIVLPVTFIPGASA